MRRNLVVGTLLVASAFASSGRTDPVSSSVGASGSCTVALPCPVVAESRTDALETSSPYSFDGCVGPFILGNGRAIVHGNNRLHIPTACINFEVSTGSPTAELTTSVAVMPAAVLPAAEVGLEGGTSGLTLTVTAQGGTHLTLASACLHVMGQPSSDDPCTTSLNI